MKMLDRLKALAKENNMKCSYINKDEIIGLLLDKQIITTWDLRNPAVVGEKKKTVKLEVDPNKYAYLKPIRTSPKVVEIYDRKTSQTNVYPSPYKLRRALNISPRYKRDGKIWKNRYEVKVRQIPSEFNEHVWH